MQVFLLKLTWQVSINWSHETPTELTISTILISLFLLQQQPSLKSQPPSFQQFPSVTFSSFSVSQLRKRKRTLKNGFLQQFINGIITSYSVHGDLYRKWTAAGASNDHIWWLYCWCRQQQWPLHHCQSKLSSLRKRLCSSWTNWEILQWQTSLRLDWSFFIFYFLY